VTAVLLGSLFVPVGLMLLMLAMQAVEVRLERAASRSPGELGTVVDLPAAEALPSLPEPRGRRATPSRFPSGARPA
jgi:hypothetical protein